MGLALTGIVEPAALAQTTLTVWMEAPAQVQAGESFEVDVFLRGETDLFDDSPEVSGFNSFALSPTATGLGQAVVNMETTRDAEMSPWGLLDAGTYDPTTSALLDVTGFQGIPDTFPLTFWEPGNPIRGFSFRVDLVAGLTGELEIQTLDPFMWFSAIGQGFGGVTSDDPGVTLDLQPLTVQIIPTPAAPAIGLALLVGGTRRRRSGH